MCSDSCCGDWAVSWQNSNGGMRSCPSEDHISLVSFYQSIYLVTWKTLAQYRQRVVRLASCLIWLNALLKTPLFQSTGRFPTQVRREENKRLAIVIIVYQLIGTLAKSIRQKAKIVSQVLKRKRSNIRPGNTCQMKNYYKPKI